MVILYELICKLNKLIGIHLYALVFSIEILLIEEKNTREEKYARTN